MTDTPVRIDTCLDDKDMRRYDYSAKQYVATNWTEMDYPLTRIESALSQRAGSWSAGSVHIIQERTPISSQGKAGSCVANAWCDMLEILDGLDGTDKVEQLSRRFLYWCARYLHAATDKDGGTYLRAAAHQLSKIGIIEERYFPYSDSDEYILSGGAHASPALGLYTMASNNRLVGFYRVTSFVPEQRLRELETAIRANHPVVFGAPVSKAFTTYRGGGDILNPPNAAIGSHAMIIVGVGYEEAKRWWMLRNSWGSSWGDDGHCKVSDDYVLTFRDLWIGTRMHELV